ncbi:RfaG Glycosyltransferase [Candidatus Nanopelagicaceae bacterium]
MITGIFPPDSGGPAKFSLEFGQWVAAQGIHVQIQTYTDDFSKNLGTDFCDFQAVARHHNIFVRYLEMIQAIGKGVTGDTHVLSVGAFLESYISSLIFGFSYVAKVPGDIVWERARNNGITKVEIDAFQNERLNLKYRIFRYLYSKSLKRARIVIVPSVGLYKLCLKWGVSESKLRLIHNSVDATSESRECVEEKKFDLITVCRLAPWKGVDELIEYAAKRKLNLLILGDGPDKARLESLASALSAKVKFAGEVAHQQVRDSLAQSKLFVLNSYYEGLPHALVEARAAGVLTVGRAGTGSEEVINDDIDGFLIRTDRSLEETLDMALAMLSDSQSMISEAKIDSAQRFSKASNFPAILNEIQMDRS